MTVVDRISNLSLSVFELSDEIEQACHSTQGRKLVRAAVVDRCEKQPDFRQDLVDLGLAGNIIPDIEWEEIPRLVGRNRDMKLALKNQTRELSIAIHDWLQGTVREARIMLRAASSLCKACAENKSVFINNQSASLITQRLLGDDDNRQLLELLATLVSDDDKFSKIPCHVFARDQLLEQENLEALRRVLRKYADNSPHMSPKTILTLVRELSVSQTTAKIFAMDEGYLKYATRLVIDCKDISLRATAAKYLRQASFCDEMKHLVWDTLLECDSLVIWIYLSFEDEGMCVNLFATLANLTLKEPIVAMNLVQKHPVLIDLTQNVLSRGASSAVNSCMHFLRNLAKTTEGRKILNDSLLSYLNAIQVTGTDTVRTISDEITHRLSRSESSAES